MRLLPSETEFHTKLEAPGPEYGFPPPPKKMPGHLLASLYSYICQAAPPTPTRTRTSRHRPLRLTDLLRPPDVPLHTDEIASSLRAGNESTNNERHHVQLHTDELQSCTWVKNTTTTTLNRADPTA